VIPIRFFKTPSILRCTVAFLFLASSCAHATARTPEHSTSRQSASATRVPRDSQEFILGADASFVQQQEDVGIRFSDRGHRTDLFALLADQGFNWIRLRIFCDPRAPDGYSAAGYCDLAHTIQMAKRVKAAHMRFLLDLHYSDTWADPGHQRKPAAWAKMNLPELQDAVRKYTRDVLLALKEHDASPDMVQIGNEINHGILAPDGEMWRPGGWDAFCNLLKAGIAGAKSVEPSIPIMLHIACGGQNDESRAFFDQVIARGVRFDVIGQFYYPRWHGTLDDLRRNLTDLATRYPQDIVVVEYSVPHVREINDIVRGLPNGKGRGTFIWEPTAWAGPALFTTDGRAKASIRTYSKMAEDYGLR
jgi:arabinogalactan endo-1,4-beta-galactosidase